MFDAVLAGLHWLARILNPFENRGTPMRGRDWEAAVHHLAGRACTGLHVQGPGHARLFGNCGRTGLCTEIDCAVWDGRDRVLALEAKGYEDLAMPRAEIFVFGAKIRDHEERRRTCIEAVLVSAGRIDDITCRWAVAHGIDVVDPDRLPVALLLRAAEAFPRGAAVLVRPWRIEWLRELLNAEPSARSLRTCSGWRTLGSEGLRDVETLQHELSADLLTACAGCADGYPREKSIASFLASRARALARLGLSLPPDSTRPEAFVEAP